MYKPQLGGVYNRYTACYGRGLCGYNPRPIENPLQQWSIKITERITTTCECYLVHISHDTSLLRLCHNHQPLFAYTYQKAAYQKATCQNTTLHACTGQNGSLTINMDTYEMHVIYHTYLLNCRCRVLQAALCMFYYQLLCTFTVGEVLIWKL